MEFDKSKMIPTTPLNTIERKYACEYCKKEIVKSFFDDEKQPNFYICENFDKNPDSKFRRVVMRESEQKHQKFNSVKYSECHKMFNRNNLFDKYKKLLKIPLRFFESSLDNFKCKDGTIQILRDTISNKSFSEFVIFQSPNPGIGKTHLAIGFILEIAKTNLLDVKFITFNEFMAEIYQSIESKRIDYVIDCYSRVDVLCLDDLGPEHKTPYTVSILNRIINNRYNNMLLTVVTTNLKGKEIIENYDGRIYSRITSGLVFTFEGTDKRAGKLNGVSV